MRNQWLKDNLSLSALKALAVYKALKVDDSLVTVSYRTILNSQQSWIPLLYSLELRLNILSSYSSVCLLNLNALVVA